MTQGTNAEETVLDVLANLANYPPALHPLARFVASDAPKTFTSNGTVWIAEGGAGGGGGSGPPTALGYFDPTGALTGDPLLTPLGTSYGRPQLHDTRIQTPPVVPVANVVWRQGALSSDGDAADIEGDGIVIYGPGPDGTMSGTNYTFARIKSNRFAIRASILGTDIGYLWRVDNDEQYFTDDTGARTFEITRAKGDAKAGSFAWYEAKGYAGVVPIGQGGKVVVPTPVVDKFSRFTLTWQAPIAPLPAGEPQGLLFPYAITIGTSFEIRSTAGENDNGKPVYWQIIPRA